MNFSFAKSDKGFFRKLFLRRSQSDLAAFNHNDQITYLSLTALAIVTLSLARWLKPSANGFGTHEQIGLPPCLFFKLTGVPCPTCGMTTSFAHSARFHFYQAIISQPFGFIAFWLTVISIPLFLVLLRRRVPWSITISTRGVDWLIYVLLFAGLLSWLYKIAAVKMLLS